MRIPLFPLNTVLFPGGPLPLRVFEPRYLDMLSACMKGDASFGVLLIEEGRETGPSTTFNVGTTATVTDWYQGSDGILGITAIGGQRFHVLRRDRQPDGLNVADVELIANEKATPLPLEFKDLSAILDNILDDLGKLYEGLPRFPDDAVWVTNRFLEVLPIDLREKQYYLETEDVLARLRFVTDSLAAIRNRTKLV